MGTSTARRTGTIAFGVAFVVLGLLAGALAVYGALDEGEERPVGLLVSSNLDDVPAPVDDPGAEPPGTAPGPLPPIPSDVPQWPPTFQGRPPAFGADGDPPPADAGDLPDGFYAWSDFAGFHVWLVGGLDGAATIEVITDDTMTATPTGGDPGLVTTDDRFALGRGDENAPVVGVDFNPGFFVRQLELTVSGDVPLFLGTAATPTTSPAVLRFEVQG